MLINFFKPSMNLLHLECCSVWKRDVRILQLNLTKVSFILILVDWKVFRRLVWWSVGEFSFIYQVWDVHNHHSKPFDISAALGSFYSKHHTLMLVMKFMHLQNLCIRWHIFNMQPQLSWLQSYVETTINPPISVLLCLVLVSKSKQNLSHMLFKLKNIIRTQPY